MLICFKNLVVAKISDKNHRYSWHPRFTFDGTLPNAMLIPLGPGTNEVSETAITYKKHNM